MRIGAETVDKAVRKEDLAIGLAVVINPRSDRTRKLLVSGEIEAILTNASTHPHGIMVRLTNGEIGRVKKIIQVAAADLSPSSSLKLEGSEEQSVRSCLDVAKGGENHNTEFKTSMLWSARLSKKDIESTSSAEVKKYGRSASKVIIAKTLAAFLNSDGGVLAIGIKENKEGGIDEIVGIDSEFGKLADPCIDGYRRMMLDGVIKAYFPSFVFNHLNSYLKLEFEETDGVTVCCVRAFPSEKKVFLNINKEEVFVIRVDASTRQIHGEEIVDYCVKRFK